MLKWLRIALARPEATPRIDERALALEREAQGLRLELQERDRSLANLKSDFERQRSTESTRIADSVQSQIERLMADAAAPAGQLVTQAHLLEVEAKPVQAKDVLAVAKRFLRTLEDHGLTTEGTVGEMAAFDPNRHEPLNSNSSIAQGQQVVTRFVAVSYRGKILRKAGVELSSGDGKPGNDDLLRARS